MATHFWNLAGILLMLSGLALAADYITSGESGEECGDNGTVCLSDRAACNEVTMKCDCHRPKYAYGDGRYNCYRGNTFRTEIVNDPNVISYNNISVGLPIPCRYLWTRTKTYLKDKARNRVGYCEADVYAFQQKWRGKFYVGGFDIAIRVTYDNGTIIMASIRKYGNASNGIYYHYVDATDNQFLPQGPWGDDYIRYYDPDTNLFIKCQYDDPNNLAFLYIMKCGIRAQFRPYDLVLRRGQPQIPHAAFEVNCAFHPVFLDQEKVVAIAPATDHQGGPTLDGYILPGLDRQQTLIYRAINSDAAQNGPFPTEQCQIAKDVMARCDDDQRAKAFKNCLWILKSPKFIRCYDYTESGALIMELFNRCFDVYCNGADCNTFIESITYTGCHTPYPPDSDIMKFISGRKCP